MVTSIKYDNSPLYYKATLREDTVTVPAKTTLLKGTLLGEVSSTGKLKKFVKTSVDGSEMPMAILNRDLTNAAASAADMTADVIILGIINENKLALDAGVTLDDIISATVEEEVISKGKIRTVMKNNGILAIRAEELTAYGN
jgi:NAD(P)H-nitrite reductase large subunit